MTVKQMTDAELRRIASDDPLIGWKYGFTRQMAAELLGLREAMREHARLDEEMDPCDGNPCSLRAALKTDGTKS